METAGTNHRSSSSRFENMANSADMEHEWGRLISFKTFPGDAPVYRAQLASAGFYYTGVDDEVRCFSCSYAHKAWQRGDSPVDIHRTKSPQCKFIKGEENENKPIHDFRSTRRPDIRYPPPLLHNQNTTVSTQESNTEPAQTERKCHLDVDIQSIIMSDTKFKDFSERVLSFSKWTSSSIQDPRNLAEAGFVFTGNRNSTCCHVCGVVLEQWQTNDDPWEEHKRLSPKCEFVKLHRPTTRREDTPTRKSRKTRPSIPEDYVSSDKSASQHTALTHQTALSEYNGHLSSNFLSVDTFDFGKSLWETTARSLEDENRRLIDENKDLKQQLKQQSGQLEEKTEQLSRLKQCKLCLSHDMNVTLLPCGHIMCCVDCSLKIEDRCPNCRAARQNTNRI